jgi:hypothetical protein
MRKSSQITFNKHFNRYESSIDHVYAPFNYSGFEYGEVKPYKGKIKCRLVHFEGGSIIHPDFIFLKNGWIQPLHYTAPQLIKIDENTIVCNFFIDIQNGETIKVKTCKDGFITNYLDGSQLYDCEIYGPDDIEEYTCGDYQLIEGNICLILYHHTNEKGFDGITASKSLWTSKWNYRGNKECENYGFVYFTHLPKIEFPNDLITIAMSSDGNIDYMIDSFQQPDIVDEKFRDTYKDYIYTAKVYRSTTTDRNRALQFLVPVESIDIKHVYRHDQGNAIFYEICFPYIHRIKALKASVVTFCDKQMLIKYGTPMVHGEYAIIGDARTKEGLAAPFEEEETKQIHKIENCKDKTVMEFWFDHANTDLFTKIDIEPMKMKDVPTNPTK